MQTISVGFWGAFFGCTAFAAVAALLAFGRSARRVALTGAVSALLPALYALVFLDWLPITDTAQVLRLRAFTAIACAAALVLPLLLLLGVVRRRNALVSARWMMLVAGLAALLLAVLMPAHEGFVIGIVVASIVAIAGIGACAFSAFRGERTAWTTSAALACICVGMWGVDWIALNPGRAPWQLHALSALAGMGFLLCIGAAMWERYSYLIEVTQVMRQGPDYDPVTRMRVYEPGKPLPEGLIGEESQSVGLMAVCLANLKALEELHGRAAYNHGLFVCASRLRRLSLPAVEIVRLGEDGFLVVLRHFADVQQLIDLARTVGRRLARPVHLGTRGDVSGVEGGGALWAAAPGIGLLIEQSTVDLELAIAGSRSMARTAWSFTSGIAWYDEAGAEIAELPAHD